MATSTRIIAFLYFTALVAVLVAHYPFEGYTDTVTVQAATRLPKWHSDRPACGKAEQAAWQEHHDWVLSSPEELAKMAVPAEQVLQRRRVAETLGDRCVSIEIVSPERDYPRSFLEWRSLSPLVPWLATGMNLAVAVGSVSVVAVAAFLLLGQGVHRKALK